MTQFMLGFWVLGFQLGYCAQTISPSCIPSLRGLAANKTIAEAHDQPAHNISLPSSEQLVSDPRPEVRKLSLVELEKFHEQIEKGNQRR